MKQKTITIKEKHLRDYLKTAFDMGKNDMYDREIKLWINKVIDLELRK